MLSDLVAGVMALSTIKSKAANAEKKTHVLLLDLFAQHNKLNEIYVHHREPPQGGSSFASRFANPEEIAWSLVVACRMQPPKLTAKFCFEMFHQLLWRFYGRKFMVYRCASRVLLALDLGLLVWVCEDEPGAYSSALMTRGGLYGASRAPLAFESEI